MNGSSNDSRLNGVCLHHLFDVDPVFRAVEHRFEHGEDMAGQDGDVVAFKRHMAGLSCGLLVERVCVEKNIDRCAIPPQSYLPIPLQRLGVLPGVHNASGKAR